MLKHRKFRFAARYYKQNMFLVKLQNYPIKLTYMFICLSIYILFQFPFNECMQNIPN